MYTDWHAMIDSKYVTVEVTRHMIQYYKGHFDTLFKKLHVYASKSMSSLVETVFPIVKPNVVPLL